MDLNLDVIVIKDLLPKELRLMEETSKMKEQIVTIIQTQKRNYKIFIQLIILIVEELRISKTRIRCHTFRSLQKLILEVFLYLKCRLVVPRAQNMFHPHLN